MMMYDFVKIREDPLYFKELFLFFLNQTKLENVPMIYQIWVLLTLDNWELGKYVLMYEQEAQRCF